MKMNKEQRCALIERIKKEARAKNNAAEQAVIESYVPSEEYIKYKQIGEKHQKLAKQLFSKYKAVQANCYCSADFGKGESNYVASRIQTIEQEEAINAVRVDYDFSNLENDLILGELDGVSVEHMVSEALNKYAVKA